MSIIDRRAYRKGTCFDTVKKKFHTLKEAQNACKAIDEVQPNRTMRAYECGDHWHLTSKPDYKVRR